MSNQTQKLTSMDEAKDQIIGKIGTERRDRYEREIVLARIKSLFNWGELSRLLSGTRSVVLKDKYPKKHEPFINDLCDAVKPVLVKYGYEKPEVDIYIGGKKVEGIVSVEYDCAGSHHAE